MWIAVSAALVAATFRNRLSSLDHKGPANRSGSGASFEAAESSGRLGGQSEFTFRGGGRITGPVEAVSSHDRSHKTGLANGAMHIGQFGNGGWRLLGGLFCAHSRS